MRKPISTGRHPGLKIVDLTQTPPGPKRLLGTDGARLWRELVDELGIGEADACRREELLLACEGLDRLAVLADKLKSVGYTGADARMLLQAENQTRALVARMLSRLRK
jgi:hypothetical protein